MGNAEVSVTIMYMLLGVLVDVIGAVASTEKQKIEITYIVGDLGANTSVSLKTKVLEDMPEKMETREESLELSWDSWNFILKDDNYSTMINSYHLVLKTITIQYIPYYTSFRVNMLFQARLLVKTCFGRSHLTPGKLKGDLVIVAI